jgi:hypothetical protein
VTEQLDELRQMAEQGKFVHLSVYAQWGAHNSPTVFHASFITPWGQGHADNIDPIAAITEAVHNAPKERQRHTPVHVKSSAQTLHIGLDSGHAVSHAQAPAPVVSKPIKPARQQNDRKTPQGQDVVVPNLMELFK